MLVRRKYTYFLYICLDEKFEEEEYEQERHKHNELALLIFC